jgi:hypothetical protein
MTIMSTPQPNAEKKPEESAEPSNGEKKPGEEKKKLPQLGALEDDDEFEVSWLLLQPYIPLTSYRTSQQQVRRLPHVILATAVEG